MKQVFRSGAAVVLAFVFVLPSLAEEASWIETSNGYANQVMQQIAKFNPEGAGGLGVDGLDEEITDFTPGVYDRFLEAWKGLQVSLEASLETETHPKVRQDIGILIKSVEDSIISAELDRNNMLPYFNLSQTVFGGIRALIDPLIESVTIGRR